MMADKTNRIPHFSSPSAAAAAATSFPAFPGFDPRTIQQALPGPGGISTPWDPSRLAYPGFHPRPK